MCVFPKFNRNLEAGLVSKVVKGLVEVYTIILAIVLF